MGKSLDASAHRRVRIGLIGAGAWARACHLPVLVGQPADVQIVAVSDVDLDRANGTAEEFSIAHAYTDWRDIFDHELDACIVSTPAAVHYEQATAALEAGTHVLVEKPMTLTRVDAEVLVTKAAELERELIVSFGWNYSRPFEAGKAYMQEDRLGPLEHVSLHMASGTRDLLLGRSLSSTGQRGPVARSSTWTDSALSGGGYAAAQLCHAFGVLFGLIDDDLVTATAVAFVPENKDVELNIAASGFLDSGATIAISGASFHAGLEGDRHQLELRLFGRKGNMLVDFGRDTVRLVDSNGVSCVELPEGCGVYDGTGPARALVAAAQGDRRRNRSDGVLGARTVRALEAVYESCIRTPPGPKRSHDVPTSTRLPPLRGAECS